jgi:ubiquitin C-terminal hydrolase
MPLGLITVCLLFLDGIVSIKYFLDSQLGNDYCGSFELINAPLASYEDISIESSTQNLANRSSSTAISRAPFIYNSNKSSRRHQSRSHEKIKIEGTLTNRSHSQSASQLHYSNKEPNAKTRFQSSCHLSTSKNGKRQIEEKKSSVRDILRLSDKKIKTVDASSLNSGIHTTFQEQIPTKSILEYSDSIVLPTHLEEKTIASAAKNEQDDVKNILQSSESSLQEIRCETENTFRDFLLRPTDVQRGHCGLRNIGNTCFMNSALQCLSNVSDLTEYILKNDVTDILNTTNDLGTHGKLALAYANLIKKMWSGEQTIAEGSAVKRYVSELSPRFAGYNQQDSHEFLNVLLDALHEDLKRDSETVENEISLISEMFYGQIRSTVTCACGEPLITFDSISFLALPIPNLPVIPPRRINSSKSVKRTTTLEDCFNEVFKVEKLSENGQWYCNKCDCLMDAEKKLDLWTLPQVLILQLKRFTYDLSSNVKIQTLVEYPIHSPLNLNRFITNPEYNGNTLYELIAISSHTGSLAGGHYTTYAKNFLTNKWLHFNDEIVREADEKTLLSSNAYFLVYRRQ